MIRPTLLALLSALGLVFCADANARASATQTSEGQWVRRQVDRPVTGERAWSRRQNLAALRGTGWTVRSRRAHAQGTWAVRSSRGPAPFVR